MSTIKSHVRCLSFNDPLLLAGIGSFIFIWHHIDNSFKFKRSISFMMKDNVIGIKFVDNHSKYSIIVYTIHSLYLCQILLKDDDLDDLKFEILKKIYINYMILDLISICKNKDLIIAAINSRNELIIKKFFQYNLQDEIKINGTKQCILYSAKILDFFVQNNELDEIILASGTVFTEIIIWSVKFSNHDVQNVQELQILSNHNGVIFSIEYNQYINKLITASDDRSICLWTSDNVEWNENKFKLKKIYYGHESRIWSLLILNFNDNISILISCGEDSSIIIWLLNEPYGMFRKHNFKINNRIWCLNQINNNELIIGGSDCSIQLLNFENLLQQNLYKMNEFQYQNQSIMVKSIKFLKFSSSNNELKIITSSLMGKFILINKELKEEKMAIHYEEIFDDYIKMVANNQRNLIIIASKYGHLAIIDDNNEIICIKKIFNEKIIDLNFINDDRLIVCLLNGKIYIVHINNNDIIVENKLQLPTSKHHFNSCGLLIQNNLLIIGDYSGNIFSYWLNFDHNEPFRKYYHIHGQNGVTNIQRQQKFIYSSGRNGQIIQYILIINDKNVVVDFYKLRIYLIVSNINWIDGFDFIFNNGDEPNIVYGFDCRKFLVWYINQDDGDLSILFNEECGGGHRSFDVYIEYFNNDLKN